MYDGNTLRERLLRAECQVLELSEDLSEVSIAAEDVDELRDILDVLEIHEEEVRRLKQRISLTIRDYTLLVYSESLKQRRDRGEQ